MSSRDVCIRQIKDFAGLYRLRCGQIYSSENGEGGVVSKGRVGEWRLSRETWILSEDKMSFPK